MKCTCTIKCESEVDGLDSSHSISIVGDEYQSRMGEAIGEAVRCGGTPFLILAHAVEQVGMGDRELDDAYELHGSLVQKFHAAAVALTENRPRSSADDLPSL